MKPQKVTFKNNKGEELKGQLVLPKTQDPKVYAIFAHCFTCGKNLKVIKQISLALTNLGIGVLSFDFTGLGQSEGDFANTNFSHDVEDLIQASQFLEENYTAPSLLIGHSLGGTAALFAAKKLQNIKAIVTIASPSQPSHVENLIKSSVKEIEKNNEALVNIGGRDFTIKKQFLEDIKANGTKDFLSDLKKPLLVMHSPLDKIVSIKNAEELYQWAHHPKSFISLNQADHLLNENIDARYIGNLIGNWAAAYLSLQEEDNPALKSKSQSSAILKLKNKFTTHLKIGDYGYIGDEPIDYGGNNYGPTPYDFLTAALAECTAMTLHVFAKHKKWDLQEVKVHVDHEKKKVEQKEGNTIQQDVITKKIEILGNLDESQVKRLVEIGDRCPIHKTLHSDVQISSELIS
ncbi:hydrolase of the alpha/beta hydrolase family with an OsmC domain [Psychroflexus torquis ATCC 700755]|uniref:Hydrolase of the alpha/beta hydrolase family with an OsmC domain n=1 Tax=Psychroflexus torquis (strain ATCC 700755 / CIP 106069 / ACAM 623) TaxID=313595 RepID=K4IHQ9_PSYTT|nr:bifunctional alpha/beta hydrolase/OsmC family protein [Psychroflexus torquis]AFU70062.1 hydrolase of the alpha/beta hydrolase family with an OsmC domain [Psychroflexus torquis ATCC 700755]